MELYDKVAFNLSKSLTLAYSTSFSLSTRLFPLDVRKHIYAIYGLVRIADEIVDTYKGSDAKKLLDDFENEIYRTIKSGYSTNPIIHAFGITARTYSIERNLIRPFFISMAMDLDAFVYTNASFKDYVYGSAEVVGLMCLKVFCNGDVKKVKKLTPGARALGSAYQKVNFLRDIASDKNELGRLYFPGYTFESFDEKAKQYVIEDIKNDFDKASLAIKELPKDIRIPVHMSYTYYSKLLDRIHNTPISTLKIRRVRINNFSKLRLLIGNYIVGRIHS
jgi:phytoene synthase